MTHFTAGSLQTRHPKTILRNDFETDDMEFFSFSTDDIYRVIGIAGFVAYVANYAALSFRLVSGDSIVYFAGNTLAATLVLISLTTDFNMASVLIQVFWIGIGLGAILLRARRSILPSPATDPGFQTRRA